MHASVPCLATLMATVVSPLASAKAEAAGTNLRDFVEARCGTELAAFELTVPAGQSIWQRQGEMPLDNMPGSTRQVGAWLASAYPLIDAAVLAGSKLRPEQRVSIAGQIGTAIALTDCLQPSPAHVVEYQEDGPRDAYKEIRFQQCYVEHAKNLHQAMLSELGADDLHTLARNMSEDVSDCMEAP
jgi:hypothetical protein